MQLYRTFYNKKKKVEKVEKVLLFLITNEIKTFISYSFVDFGPNSILYVCFVDIIFCIKLLLQTEYAALQYI